MYRLAASLLCAVLLLIALPARAQSVQLENADSQVFVQANGAVDVIYTLDIVDPTGRSEIKKIGQFYEPIAFNRFAIVSA